MIKHIVRVLLATILLGTLVMELPPGVRRLSADGLAIAIGGPIALCFLPALIVSLIIAGVYYLIKKTQLLAFKYFIWGVWAIPASLMLLGAISHNANAGNLIEDAKSGLIIQRSKGVRSCFVQSLLLGSPNPGNSWKPSDRPPESSWLDL